MLVTAGEPSITALVTRGGITALWAVATQTSPVGNGSARFIELRLNYRIGTQRGGDTLRTTIYCP